MKLFAAGEGTPPAISGPPSGGSARPGVSSDYRGPHGDIWTQDFFEPAYTSVLAEDGQQVVRIMVRPANVSPTRKPGKARPRPAGKFAFTECSYSAAPKAAKISREAFTINLTKLLYCS